MILWIYDQSQAMTLQTDPAGLLELLSHIPGDQEAKPCAVLYVEGLLSHLCTPRYRETLHQKWIFPWADSEGRGFILLFKCLKG